MNRCGECGRPAIGKTHWCGDELCIRYAAKRLLAQLQAEPTTLVWRDTESTGPRPAREETDNA